MSFDAQRLYELLPAIYRIRDSEQGEPLRALLEVIAGEIGVLEENLDQLYDDQFIETCADWVVPYIGDLIGARALHGVTPQVSSPRAEVANTIRLRRRKGTAAVLEELAHDVTGWPARVVEFFEWLGWKQFMNHARARRAADGSTCAITTLASALSMRAAHSTPRRIQSTFATSPRVAGDTTFRTSGSSCGACSPIRSRAAMRARSGRISSRSIRSD